MIHINVEDLIKSISTLSTEIQKSTEIIKKELGELNKAFESLQPSVQFSEIENGLTAVSQISQAAFGVITQSMLQISFSLQGFATDITDIQLSLTNLSSHLEKTANSLGELERAQKNAQNASSASTAEITKYFEGFQQGAKNTAEVIKGLEDGAKTISKLSMVSASTSSALSGLSSALGVVGLAFTAVDLTIKAVNWYSESQQKAIEAQRQHNEELLKYQQISEAVITNGNHQYYEDMAQSYSTALALMKEAMEDYANADNAFYDGLHEEFMDAQEIREEIIKNLQYDFIQLGIDAEVTAKAMTNELILKNELEKSYTALNAKVKEYNKQKSAEILSLQTLNQSVAAHTNDMKKLENAYATLARGESLSAENLLELAQLYPKVAKCVSDNAYTHEELMGIIQEERALSKQAALDDIELKRQALITEKERVEGLIKSYDADALGHNEALEQKEQGLHAYKTLSDEVVKAILKNNPVASGAVVSAVDIAAKAAAKAAAQKKLDEILNNLDILDAQEQIILGISLDLDITPPKYPGGGSFPSATTEIVQQAEKELSLFEQIWNEYEDLIENKYFTDIEHQRTWLAERLENVELLNSQESKFNTEMKRLSDEMLKIQTGTYNEQIKIMEDYNQQKKEYTDQEYTDLIGHLENMAAEYEGYDEILEKIQKHISQVTSDQSKYRADEHKKHFDGMMADVHKHYDVLKSYDGVRFGAGDDDVFSYSTDMEIAKYEKLMEINGQFIDSLMAKKGALSDYEKEQLAKAQQDQEEYLKTVNDLNIKYLKEKQAALEEAFKQEEKLRQEAFKKEEQAYKDATEAIKSEYSQRIAAAQKAADEEIAVLEKKIKDIDNLMAQQAIADQDDEYGRKKNQLEQLIAYEVDDSNKYELQKELDRLNDDYAKRKQKEALEAQKSALQEEISNIRDKVSQEKAELENLRDTELEQLQNQFEAKKEQYELETEIRGEEIKKQQALIVKQLEEELIGTQDTAANKEKIYKADTKAHKIQLNTQEKNINTFSENVLETFTRTSNDVQRVGETSIIQVLKFLNEKVEEFAEAGREAGRAYVEAYLRELERIGATASSITFTREATSRMVSDIVRAEFAAAMPTGQSSTANDVNIYQTITAPVATPSLVARETKRELQQALRYS